MAWTERYVRADAAGGGNGTTDANSGANGAYTWAEMLAVSPLSGIRFNIKAGNYSRTTNNDTFSGTAPAAATPMWIRGFNSVAGDLESQSRNSLIQALNTTNYPDFSYTTGSLTLPQYTIVTCVDHYSEKSGDALIPGFQNFLRRVRMQNNNGATASAAATAAAFGTNYVTAIDCDFIGTSQNPAAYVLTCDRGQALYCRLGTNSAGSRLVSLGAFGHAVGCQFMDANIALRLNGLHNIVEGCSFRNIAGDHIIGNGGGIVLANNVAWGTGSGNSRWIGNVSAAKAMLQINNAVGNMALADANEGDWPVIGEIALTADPFTSSSDLTPNSNGSGGALLKGAGLWPYNDIGAIQVMAGAGGGLLTHPGMAGGMRG